MPNPRRVTIATIAERAGISKGAVSFALNNRPGVSAETRERVLRIARELNWRPHQAARALSGARAGAVGFVVNRPARALGTEAFFAELVSGIQSGLQASRTSLDLMIAADLDQELETYQDWWNEQRVDAVIMIDPRIHDPRTSLLSELRLPLVMIGSHASPPGTPATVWIDDHQVGLTLFGYLCAIGHRRVAYVGGREEFEHTLLRARALEECALDRGLESADVVTTDFSTTQSVDTVRDLLARQPRPTALVFDNDVMATSGLGVAQEMGFDVPRDLSIASFDDSPLARLIRPSLTAMTRDTFELGELAAQTALRQIATPTLVSSVPGPPVRLSVRDSTAPPASHRATG